MPSTAGRISTDNFFSCTLTTYLPRGAKVTGTVIASTAANMNTGRPATFTVRFDTLYYHQQAVPLVAQALAIANFTAAGDAFPSTNDGSDRGNSSPAAVSGP